MEGIFTEIKGFASFLFDIFVEGISKLPKIASFLLWVIAGVFILPCVFIAGNYLGAWEKWGEDF